MIKRAAFLKISLTLQSNTLASVARDSRSGGTLGTPGQARPSRGSCTRYEWQINDSLVLGCAVPQPAWPWVAPQATLWDRREGISQTPAWLPTSSSLPLPRWTCCGPEHRSHAYASIGIFSCKRSIEDRLYTHIRLSTMLGRVASPWPRSRSGTSCSPELLVRSWGGIIQRAISKILCQSDARLPA